MQARAVRLADYAPPEFLVDQVDLRFELEDEATLVHSRLQIRRNPAAAASESLFLNGQALDLQSVAIDNRKLEPADYQLDADSLRLAIPGDQATIDIVTRIKPQENTALQGLYRSSRMYCTQCEAEGFRRITYYPDRPDVMARFSTTIVADRARFPVLLSNGNPVAEGTGIDGRHWARWEDPWPKPSYLFALVAGDLVHIEDRFRTKSGRDVRLRIYVEPGNGDKCAHAMESLKHSMRWDEEVYGLEYDLDVFNIVAVGDFNMGAMENKGLNIFNTKFVLAKPETATDADFLGIQAVVAHEYFHNWTGNRVTCRDWFQLSLKEGLTVFRDQQFQADRVSAAVQRIRDVQRLRQVQFAEDAGPTAHPVRPDSYVEINNFYTPTVYEKGSEVLRMYQTLLGRDGFRKGMDLYFRRHDGQAVTTDDFLAAMADANGADLEQFRLWYSQAGTPQIAIEGNYDAAARTYTLIVRQAVPATPGQPDKRPMVIPVAIGLVAPDGADLPLRLNGEAKSVGTSRVLRIQESEERFTFVDVAAAPVPSLLRGFSAPVRLSFPYSEDELAFLMRCDSDPFNRWNAGQTLAAQILLALVAKRAAGESLALPANFIAAVRAELKRASDDRYLTALALSLPSEAYLGQLREPVDVDGIYEARRFVMRALATELRPEFEALYHAEGETGPFSSEPEAIGRRALKNQCLGYLMQLEDADSSALCLRQFREAASMTDSIAALSLIADSDMPQRQECLTAFAERWSNEPLVMDKWFAVQAMSSRPDTLGRVRNLLDHPAFSQRNPNKVYALIGSFASGNPVRFHAADGSGYLFLADQILQLDGLNPSVASRMAKPFARWRAYDKGRQAHARRHLERIAGTDGLSRDVSEIVSKSLAD